MKHFWRRILLMTLDDQINEINTKLDTLTTNVAAVTTAVSAINAASAPVDLTPVLTAIAAVQAQLLPTPTPAADSAPAPDAPAA